MRQIIRIDEDKCTGCGLCVPNCPEGALQIIDGKARLISDLFCDGLGACIGECPEGAIEVEEREAEPYDERRVMENVVKHGPNVIKAHLEHLKSHNQDEFYGQALDYLKEQGIANPLEGREKVKKASPCHGGGCPGSMMMDFREAGPKKEEEKDVKLSSQLRQWPVQLQLLSPYAPYFKEADLVIAADCVPFAYPDFHRRFLKGKALIIFCPKLDQTIQQYVDKLTELFTHNNVKSITIVHMEVPCCFGVGRIVEAALRKSGINIIIKDYTISVSGEII